MGAAPAHEELVRREGQELEAVPGHLRADAHGLRETHPPPRALGDDHVQVPALPLVVADGDAGEPTLREELREQDVARLRPPRLIEPAGEHEERVLVDETEPLVEDHENAVDMDVPRGKWDFEEVFHVPAQHDLSQGPGALLVGPVAERNHRRVVADEGHPAPFEKAGRLDRAQDGHAQALESAAQHRLIAPASPEVWPHEHGASREDGGKVSGVGHVGAMVDIAERVVVASQDLAQQHGLDALLMEEPQHGIVVGDEPPTIHGTGEVELLQVRRGDLVELRAGPVHDHPLQAPVGVSHERTAHACSFLRASPR